MKRRLNEAANHHYDLIVVGGGIYGATIAWDAIGRGLRVCLLEKSDFSSATSANSLKIIHGGLRYLQHADFRRMRESIREQRILMRIAPHLVHVLPVLIPTYGYGLRGKEILSMAVRLTRLVGLDHTRRYDPAGAIPPGRVVSREEVLNLLPGIDARGLTGGVIFYDAQVYNSERLLLSFLRSAALAGADLVNYAEVTGFLEHSDAVVGVKVRDALTGERFEVRGETILLACGPWVDRVTGLLTKNQLKPSSGFAKAVNLVTRKIFDTYAVGIPARGGCRDSDGITKNPNRLLFIAPWRDRSLIGTAYIRCENDAGSVKVSSLDVKHFLDDINYACPFAHLKKEDISFVHGGLVPSLSARASSGEVALAKHYRIRDHRDEGVKGLITVVGVKYTTARDVAEKAVDQVFRSCGRKPPKSCSSLTPVYGGQIQRFDTFLKNQIAARAYGLNCDALRRLIYNYGSAYPEVLQYLYPCDRSSPSSFDFALLKAEILHGVRMEMAQKLSDVIFRRTELGSAGHPGREVLRAGADIMSAELAWDGHRTQRELQEVEKVFATWQ
jgi:glycerol-3-phosphate dehydrogenase